MCAEVWSCGETAQVVESMAGGSAFVDGGGDGEVTAVGQAYASDFEGGILEGREGVAQDEAVVGREHHVGDVENEVVDEVAVDCLVGLVPWIVCECQSVCVPAPEGAYVVSVVKIVAFVDELEICDGDAVDGKLQCGGGTAFPFGCVNACREGEIERLALLVWRQLELARFTELQAY